MENERPPLPEPLDHAELALTREKCAGFLALVGSDASNPGDRKYYDGIQPCMVGGLPRALRALGALVGAGQALIGRYYAQRLQNRGSHNNPSQGGRFGTLSQQMECGIFGERL